MTNTLIEKLRVAKGCTGNSDINSAIDTAIDVINMQAAQLDAVTKQRDILTKSIDAIRNFPLPSQNASSESNYKRVLEWLYHSDVSKLIIELSCDGVSRSEMLGDKDVGALEKAYTAFCNVFPSTGGLLTQTERDRIWAAIKAYNGATKREIRNRMTAQEGEEIIHRATQHGSIIARYPQKAFSALEKVADIFKKTEIEVGAPHD